MNKRTLVSTSWLFHSRDLWFSSSSRETCSLRAFSSARMVRARSRSGWSKNVKRNIFGSRSRDRFASPRPSRSTVDSKSRLSRPPRRLCNFQQSPIVPRWRWGYFRHRHHQRGPPVPLGSSSRDEMATRRAEDPNTNKERRRQWISYRRSGEGKPDSVRSNQHTIMIRTDP